MSRTLRYLRYAIHGITEHPRRPRRRPRKGPARSWKYRAWVRTFPCAACGSERSVEAAHTGSTEPTQRGGTSQKATDFSCIPLCTNCHTMRPDSYHRIDGGKAGFERRYSLDLGELVRRLNADYGMMRECAGRES